MFKFPTLFGRIPHHRKFNYQPRYYNPQAEEQQAREARIRAEMGETEVNEVDLRARMSSAFRASRRQKPDKKAKLNEALVSTGLTLFLAMLLIGWLQWGNVALYLLVLVIPVWFYFRFFRK